MPSAILLVALCVCADPDPSLTVRVYDYAGVSGNTLSRAELEAQRIFRKAGIETEWILCPRNRAEEDQYPACRKPIGAADVMLQVVYRPVEGERVGHEAFGYAVPSGNAEIAPRAYLYHERVAQFVRESRGGVSHVTLLAFVMVHEIAHLLLGPEMHSPRGVMSPRWQPEELQQMEGGRLNFASDQVRALKASVRERAGKRALTAPSAPSAR